MARKIYTSQEMRDVAKCYTCSEVPLGFDKRDIAAMLRQAAAVRERIDELLLTFRSCPDERDLLNYILYGNAGKDARSKEIFGREQ